ncbi:hypothetical protein ABH944_004093 [Caballeronia udeis]|uniref:hypothetical protein n=1 Tax=Caballeronia udeis TaxID=1232866 RepID=UPI003835DD5F
MPASSHNARAGSHDITGSTDDPPCRHGLITRYNPLRVESAQWVDLPGDLAGACSVSAILGYLFKPPGRAPSDEGNTTADLRAWTTGQPSGANRA